ncbi:PilZ domain-containing protein [Fastidiosibacter lacustris]|uniref:PilZ domain-containing protein n=1 Tax=Fastidiosibacter lacustris TaxID=2056695 RepID=UPI000E355B22|nr:PilZ domain-containing protein [Fastidiosibacter lacustris]
MMTTIHITLDSKQDALEKYLPFIKQGALLTNSELQILFGEEVNLVVKISELQQEFACKGKIVWVSVDELQNKKSFGIQLLADEGFELNQVLENYLVGLIKHDK